MFLYGVGPKCLVTVRLPSIQRLRGHQAGLCHAATHSNSGVVIHVCHLHLAVGRLLVIIADSDIVCNTLFIFNICANLLTSNL